jgi:hypothetical protein
MLCAGSHCITSLCVIFAGAPSADLLIMSSDAVVPAGVLHLTQLVQANGLSPTSTQQEQNAAEFALSRQTPEQLKDTAAYLAFLQLKVQNASAVRTLTFAAAAAGKPRGGCPHLDGSGRDGVRCPCALWSDSQEKPAAAAAAASAPAPIADEANKNKKRKSTCGYGEEPKSDDDEITKKYKATPQEASVRKLASWFADDDQVGDYNAARETAMNTAKELCGMVHSRDEELASVRWNLAEVWRCLKSLNPAAAAGLADLAGVESDEHEVGAQ